MLKFVLFEGGFAVCGGMVLQCLFPTMGSSLSEVLCSVVASHFEMMLETRKPELIAAKLIPPDAERVGVPDGAECE